jgi:transposase
VNERKAQRWFKRFASGNLSLEDKERPGRPRIWDSETTKEAAEQQPSTSKDYQTQLALQRVLFIAT